MGSPGAGKPYAGKYRELTLSRQRGGSGLTASPLPTEAEDFIDFRAGFVTAEGEVECLAAIEADDVGDEANLCGRPFTVRAVYLPVDMARVYKQHGVGTIHSTRSSRGNEALIFLSAGGLSLLTSAATNGVDRADTVLFLDARHIYRQIDRAHREWTPAQIGFIANVVRLYRGEALDFTLGGDEAKAKLLEVFGNPKSKIENLKFKDVPGLCRAATLKEIEAQGWSLNPGRYVGVAAGEAVSDEDFKEQLETLNEELETLNAQARELETTIAANVAEILET